MTASDQYNKAFDTEKPTRVATADGRSRPLVVLQVLPALIEGDVGRSCIDVAFALAQAGGTPLVASSGGALVRELDRAGLAHFFLPLDRQDPWDVWRNGRRLTEIAREMGVDILHARGLGPAWSGRQAARAAGCRFVTTLHTADRIERKRRDRNMTTLLRNERAIAVSDYLRNYFLTEFSIPPEHIITVPRSIDTTLFAPERVTQARLVKLAAQWRLPEDRVIILCPAPLEQRFGQIDLIEAIARIQRNDLCCLILGQEPALQRDFQRKLEKRIEELDLTNTVHLVDQCPDLPAAYMLATVVVSPSREPEAFCRVCAEALAMERPVIVSAHGAAAEVAEPGPTVWLTPPADPTRLAEALEQALSLNPAHRAALAEPARRRVSERFHRNILCSGTLRVYLDLMAESPPNEQRASKLNFFKIS
ncbi:Glycosyltransferase involved in cell wall bisynthesis [Azospirillaceae bacterium]